MNTSLIFLSRALWPSLLVLCLTFFVPGSPLMAREATMISVGIVTGASSATVSSTSGMTMADSASRRRSSSKLRGGEDIQLVPAQKGMALKKNGKAQKNPVGAELLFTASRNSMIICNGKHYRGTLKVRLDSLGRLTCINTLPMEEYLYGVIASEMLISSPPEALKAQAVVARTFAYTYMEKFTKEGFNLSADTSCQVYGGYDAEDPRAIKAVDSTRGQVLMSQGNTISAVYTSVCGGHTESNEDAWDGAPKPYLRGVACGFCSDAAKYSWEYTMPVDTFLSKLSAKGITVNRLQSLKPVSWSANGRVKLVSLGHDGTDTLMSASELRKLMGYGEIKSTWFDVAVDNLPDSRYEPLSGTQKINRIRELFHKRRKLTPMSTTSRRSSKSPVGVRSGALSTSSEDSSDSPVQEKKNPEDFIRNIIRSSMSKKGEVLSQEATIRINGRGHGHGVGMCQWGAANMARAGWDFKKILTHYYTGVEFRTIR